MTLLPNTSMKLPSASLKRKVFLLPLFAHVVFATGCSTAVSLRERPLDAGVARRYESDPETATRAVVRAFETLRLDLDEQIDIAAATRMLLAHKPSNWRPEYIRVVVDHVDPRTVEIRVVAETVEPQGERTEAAALEDAGEYWSREIFGQLDQLLSRRKPVSKNNR